MLTLLHVSDLHFGPPYLPKVGDALKRIAPSLEPQVLVVSGDLTQRAKAEQFAEARQYVDSLLPDIPRLIVPGNHDVPLYRVAERMKTPHALYRKYINVELNHVLSVDGAVARRSRLDGTTVGRHKRPDLDEPARILRRRVRSSRRSRCEDRRRASPFRARAGL